MFHHMAYILLAKAHPMRFDYVMEMKEMEHSHAYEIGGLAASAKDRSIAHILLRCISVAAKCLETHDTQEEVLGILDALVKETCWRADPVKEELKRTWGWAIAHPETVDPAQMHDPYYGLDPALDPGLPSVAVNPLSDTGDFSSENHPYQGYYVAPHHVLDHYPHAPCFV